jgi:hypothetical protein
MSSRGGVDGQAYLGRRGGPQVVGDSIGGSIESRSIGQISGRGNLLQSIA